MKTKLVFKKIVLILIIAVFLIFTLSKTFYSWWNSSPAEKTCALCHEITASVQSHASSSHRNLSCSECHGTALSEGVHSLEEKGKMVIHHIINKIEPVRLNEKKILTVMKNCIRCHTYEYAGWKQGGHSSKYCDIFLDTVHNKKEQLHADCLRCHGMFYDGHIEDLVEPINITGPWKFRMKGVAGNPAIPCMACHKIHFPGNVSRYPDYSNPEEIFYSGSKSLAQVFLYDRHEKSHFLSMNLPKPRIWEGGREVTVSDEPVMRTCIQCHAPDARHRAGTSDDRTPRGVHEGISCIVCHEPHSNSAERSCIYCHPLISDCKRDVTKMNTSFSNPNSPNNIHWVTCIDCHKNKPIDKI